MTTTFDGLVEKQLAEIDEQKAVFGYNTDGQNIFAFTEQGVAMLATILKSNRG